MKKRHKRLWLAGIVLLLAFCCAGFLFYHVWGPRMNDSFVSRQMGALRAAPLPASIEVLEDSGYVGKWPDGELFVVWVGMAVRTSLAPSEMEAALKAAQLPGCITIVPYELDLANKLGFSGVQKDLISGDTQGVYLIGFTRSPPTPFDERNS